MIAIFPALSVSMRAMSTPAVTAASMARVTSCCRNVLGARYIMKSRYCGAAVRHDRDRVRERDAGSDHRLGRCRDGVWLGPFEALATPACANPTWVSRPRGGLSFREP